MLRYLILIGALAAMPLCSFAMVEAVDEGAAEPMANIQQSKTEGPVWVVDAAKNSSSQGPVWVVITSKGEKRVS